MAILALGFGIPALPAWGGQGIRVGAKASVLTPRVGTPLAGYYEPRASDAVLDELFARTLVIEQDRVRAALVVCDLLSLPRHTVVAARRLIEERTGIPGAHVMIAATHQHTGPVVYRESKRDEIDGASTELGRSYTDSLPALLAGSVAGAVSNLTAARFGIAVGREEQLSYNRRYWMRDGTVGWNPGKLNTNIVRAAGPIDPEVGVLYAESTEPSARPLVTVINFAMHPDTTGGTRISADYPGVLARRLADFKGPEMVTLFANGACGNINHLDVRWGAGQSSPNEASRLGTILAAAVFKLYPRLQPVAEGRLQVRSETVLLPLPEVTPAEVAAAAAVVRRMADPATRFMEKVEALKVLDVAAREGRPQEVEVQVICLGREFAWVSLPGEAFVGLGLSIKAASPFRQTMIVELANGAIGYIPDKPAYNEGNYEVASARCAAGSGELLVSAAVRMLSELHRNAEEVP